MEDDGHMLVFGLDRYVFGDSGLAKAVSEQSGVMVWAHPYRRQFPRFYQTREQYDEAIARARRNDLYKTVRALETLNTRGTDEENRFSKDLGDAMGLPGTGGTDSHRLEDIGKCATRFERTIRDERELVAELIAGRFAAVDLRERVSNGTSTAVA